MVWTVTGELYPSRYRAQCMSMSTASNWIWNFLLAFFTPFITGAIDFRYGYVFAACCAAASVIVYFFLIEAQGKTLEEIDNMYILHVTPWKSKHYAPEAGQDLVSSDHLALASGGRTFNKRSEGEAGELQQTENVA